ncbi:putative outer membrane protein [Sphingobium sp. SYK-6]|uniref:outer membrane protein n=1 Tax=Sphingobium sp. (strain NBRC 103272 / SYK-6) TaxID=627192 RepID=UPI0002277634|nr:outer membrane beta-barrel protein [Sphingobium sp. SYK-6]BAK67852.1 putative outer membrane protein [Sphingobium sp. SYK-6]
MNKKIVLAALLAASAAWAGQAQAQTIGSFRADVHAGWDRVSIDQHTQGDADADVVTSSEKEDGVIYGGEIGYDLGLGAFSLGAYAGIEGSSAKQCAEVYTEVETCVKAGRNITLGARAGFNVAPRVLLYAKGGYSNGQVRMEYIDHVTAADSFTLSENMDGWHAGAGVQVNLLANSYVKLEYVHTDYSDYSLADGDATISGGFKRDNVLLGVGMRF